MPELTRMQIEEKEQELSDLLAQRRDLNWAYRDFKSVSEDYVRTIDSLNERIEVLAIELKPWLESQQF